jgi:hypothetical protein
MMGYLGAALATVVTLYLWTIPFNLVKISRGFDVVWVESLPFKALLRMLFLCLLCTPLAAVGAGVGRLPVCRLSCAAVLYWPIVAYLLYRAQFLTLPQWIVRFVPLRLRIRT